MYREAVIIVLIILLIIIGDILTHKFTTKTVAEISREIFLLTESVKNNKDDIQQKLNNIEKAWEKYSEKLAYYIEHNELEKVDTEIVKSKITVNNKIPIATRPKKSRNSIFRQSKDFIFNPLYKLLMLHTNIASLITAPADNPIPLTPNSLDSV